MDVNRGGDRTKSAPRHVTILGSTGSVGCSTVDLIRRHAGDFVVEALTANRNATLLAEQARRLRPRMAVVADPDFYLELKDALAGTDVQVATGREALIEAAGRPADWVMASIVGTAGLEPTLRAIRRGAIVALANKECLVSAGDIMVAEVRHNKATLIPVDSEHNAIFQVFDFAHADNVERITLTASGGPFRRHDVAAMADVTPEQAVAHPNWDMGAKISVDSATMMNKGLEADRGLSLVSDCRRPDRHPRSSPVGGAQPGRIRPMDRSSPRLGDPRHAYSDRLRPRMATAHGCANAAAATWRRRRHSHIRSAGHGPSNSRPSSPIPRGLADGWRSPHHIERGQRSGRVQRFLSRQVGFLDIARIVEQTLATAPNGRLESLDDVYEVDSAAREIARRLVSRCPARD